MYLQTESGTRKNKISKYFKPNEDYFLHDSEKGIFVITDGVSRDIIEGLYPNPSPSTEVAHLLTLTVFNHISENLKSTKTFKNLLFDAYQKGNKKIADYNQKVENKHFLPGAVSLAAIFTDSSLYYCYLGDVSARKITETESFLLTKSQTEKFRRYSKSFTRSFVRNNICNNPQHPLSYGVFTGENNALNFLSFHQTDISVGNKFHFATDGLDCFYDFETGLNLSSFNVEEIFNKAEENEENYSDSINSDDKTIIIVTRIK